jgi:nicotinate-nucleotide pyrophosphorylase (carboxylating)
MNRKGLLNKAYQRGHLLSAGNNLYKKWIDKFIIEEIEGDIGKGDITSDSVLKKGKSVKAVVYSRSEGILAGVEEVFPLLRKYKLNVNWLKDDGDRIKKGSKLLILSGNEKNILKLERSVLDILSRMSGIATLTNVLIKKTKGKVGIAPTRKTQWRYLDKKAVCIGGGLTHRLALWESILIKDNHLAALKREGVKDVIETAIHRAWENRKKGNFIEIEVFNEKQAIRAAKVFKELKNTDYPCIIMLDNIKPKKIKSIIKKLKKNKLYNHILIEASGNIMPENIKTYAASGVDVLSLGYLTKSSRALDIKLRIE